MKNTDKLLFMGALIMLVSIILSGIILIKNLNEGVKCNRNIGDIRLQLLNLQLIDEE